MRTDDLSHVPTDIPVRKGRADAKARGSIVTEGAFDRGSFGADWEALLAPSGGLEGAGDDLAAPWRCDVAPASLHPGRVEEGDARLLTYGAHLPAHMVQERFRWAARQGYPLWLWPDISVSRWEAALRAIEESLRHALTGRAAPGLLDGDPEVMGVACYTSGTGPLLGYWARRGLVTATRPIAGLLEVHLRHNARRTARLTAEATGLAAAFARHQRLPIVFLKGAHTAHTYFPAPEARPLADIELLARPVDQPTIAKMLERRGYERATDRRAAHSQFHWRRPEVPREPRTLGFVHADDPWSVNIHQSLNRQGPWDRALILLDDVVTGDMLRPWGPCGDAAVLRQPLLLLHLAVQSVAGFERLSLLRLAELAMVVRRDTAMGLLSWPAFLDMADRVGATGAVFPALHLCEELAPGTIPHPVLARVRRQTPIRVQRFVARLTPANAQRLVRYSLTEKFMWATSRRAIVRQLATEIMPARWHPLIALFDTPPGRSRKAVSRTLPR
ncbi:MAG: hypothetical protein JWR80_318 [Bradyrhizobium sp.]|nr:hypothetical protein [Bradyrhizobium sp.]